MQEITVTLAGNLVDDPELRYTLPGVPVANIRVAANRRVQDKTTGEWRDGDTVFLTCRIWRTAAENVANSLRRGDRVLLTGRLTEHKYLTDSGEMRTVVEVDVDEIGASLRHATVDIAKTARSKSRDDSAGEPAVTT
jgi:single-strand DNA-binding protein